MYSAWTALLQYNIGLRTIRIYIKLRYVVLRKSPSRNPSVLGGATVAEGEDEDCQDQRSFSLPTGSFQI